MFNALALGRGQAGVHNPGHATIPLGSNMLTLPPQSSPVSSKKLVYKREILDWTDSTA